ncbi:MAG: endolytic transglycosylase MltG [Bacteroidaceae bacterium]|nr:endolytic transglycosylase MltG [Bacteroidaceae bacterium]
MDRKRTLVIWAFNIVSIIALAMTFRCFKLIVSPQIESYDFSIYITPDNTADDIIEIISENDSKANLTGLKWLMKLKKCDDNIPTGHYVIKRGYSAKNIADLLVARMQTPVKVVINSTRTVDQIASTISSQLMMDSATIAEKLNDIEYLKSQGYNGNSVFCLIVPNTYEFYWNVSIDGFIKRMIKERDAFWNESRLEKAKAIGLTPEEVMTLASIVEEETAQNEELPIVAGLYINRLNRGMLLQADPTVIYALGGERPIRVLKKHLETDSPYNTYKYAGLPPAPIRFVNIKSIDAVLNYTKHKYLYMCAKEDFSGYHNFATTLSQHNANAARYQRALSKR